MNEAHFCSLPTQSNVYGLTNIALPDSMSKLLVACLRGKVVSIEHNPEDDSFGLASKDAHFTYIPGDAEIVSIDAFSKKADKSGVVIGITFVKNNETKPSKFLNIYSEWEPETEFDLDSIAQGCFNLELQFIPFQLYHAELICDDSKEIVFLLSGNDKKVHLFREDIFLHIFGEHPVDRFFPEFANLPSNVIWIDIRYVDAGKQRLTAMGCQDGYVRLVHVNAVNKDIINQWSIQHDSPITSIKLFEFHTKVSCPGSVAHLCTSTEDSEDEAPESEKESIVEKEKDTMNPDYHLLVCGALEVTVVYRSVLENGLHLSNQIVLPESNDYDCVLCACVADLNFDGHNEIILGTYGQELLIYRHFLPEEMKQRQQQQLVSKKNTDDSDKELDSSLHADLSSFLPNKLDGEYALIGRRSFAYPLLAIDKLDLTCDGLEELAVLSQCGLHILQHNPDDVAKICLDRLKTLVPETNSNHEIDNKDNTPPIMVDEVSNELDSLRITKSEPENTEMSGT
ncbi:KICSTOR complex protein kaptin-like [Tubulanus polymorphus]|uniref:KICSTOR complex protein kaptin-like n=1 Tax=Tubulanus polymorphus TaxID=672921 RepID=UPI003DA4CEA6